MVLERSIVPCGWEPKPVVHQTTLSALVTVEHRSNLGNHRVALVDDQ